MPTYVLPVYRYDPYGKFSQTVSQTFTYSGPTTTAGEATIVDTGAGADRLEDRAAEDATATVTMPAGTSSNVSVYAGEGWTLRDTVTGESFEVVTLRVPSGPAQGYHMVSEIPMVVGRSYEVEAFDSTPLSANGDPTLSYAEVQCYVRGTRILTPKGPVAVEHLAEGDWVQTAKSGPMKIYWIRRSTFGAEDLRRFEGLRPVVIAQGALGNVRKLKVSQQHRMVVSTPAGERFIKVRHLAQLGDGRFRIANQARDVAYYHILLERHEVIFAEGAKSESFYPGPQVVQSLRSYLSREWTARFGSRFMINCNGVLDYGPTALPVLTRKEAQIYCAQIKRQTRHAIEL